MEKDIGKIPKNETTDIVIRLDDFGGRKGLTIREFVTSDRYTGFTKSGTRIPTEQFEKFKEMINSIEPEDIKEGTEEEKELPPDQKTLDNNEEIPVEKPGRDLPDY